MHDFDLSALALGIGGLGTANIVERSLENAYGGRVLFGGMLFVRARPPRLNEDKQH